MPAFDSLSSSRSRGARTCATAAGVLLCLIALPGLAQQVAIEAKSSSLPSLHSDLKFAVFGPARLASASAALPDAADFTRQMDRVSAGLQEAARRLYRSKMNSLDAFDVFVADSAEAETRSSSSGKIALYGGIAQLAPSDPWLAFVISREMGHVLAGHHDANSAASIITSVIMNLIVPGSSLLKSVVSLAGSQTAAAAGAERQTHEADEIALRLLAAAGYRERDLADALAAGPPAARLGTGSWARAFGQSLAALDARVVAGRPVLVLAQGDAPAAAVHTAAIHTATIHTTAVQTERRVPLPHQVAATASPLPDLPMIRARPSGVAGPLLLGGFSVPARRFD